MLTALAEAARRHEICALVDASDCFDPASAAAAGVNLDRLLWVRCSERANVQQRRLNASRANQFSVNSEFLFSKTLEQVLKVTDLLLQGGGFGMVVLDLGDIPVESLRRIPLTSWFRFRRAVEPTATVLLLVEQEPTAKTCASLVLRLLPVSIHTRSSSRFFAGPAQRDLEGRDLPMACDFDAQQMRLLQADSPPPRIPENNILGHADVLQGIRLRAEVVRSWAQRKPPQSAGAQFELHTAR